MSPLTVLSRHRLPQPYRLLLFIFWLLPMGILLMSLVIGHGFSAHFFDPRLLLVLVLMACPALYIWQEGVDVCGDGLLVRVYVPRHYPYVQLAEWHLGDQPQRRVLTIWRDDGVKALQCHAVHLTDFPTLVRALDSRLERRTDLY